MSTEPAPVAAPVYHFKSADGQSILTIWPDGRAEVGPGAADLDEASRAFWAHLADLNPWQAENARLRAALAAQLATQFPTAPP